MRYAGCGMRDAGVLSSRETVTGTAVFVINRLGGASESLLVVAG